MGGKGSSNTHPCSYMTLDNVQVRYKPENLPTFYVFGIGM